MYALQQITETVLKLPSLPFVRPEHSFVYTLHWLRNHAGSLPRELNAGRPIPFRHSLQHPYDPAFGTIRPIQNGDQELIEKLDVVLFSGLPKHLTRHWEQVKGEGIVIPVRASLNRIGVKNYIPAEPIRKMPTGIVAVLEVPPPGQ